MKPIAPLKTPIAKRVDIAGTSVGVHAATLGYLARAAVMESLTGPEQIAGLVALVAAAVDIDGDAQTWAEGLTLAEAQAVLDAVRADSESRPDFP